MRGLKFLGFLLAIPVIAALGTDIYLTYHDQDFNKAMMFSNLSYLWIHYNPETYAWSMKNVSPDIWKNFVVPVLSTYTVVAAAVPGALYAAILLILKLLNLPPFRDVSVRRGHKKGQFGFGSGESGKGRIKYKRK